VARTGATVTLIAAAALLAGCTMVPLPPTYSQDELRVICERNGGWWHPDGPIGGYCEYQSDGFL
jgi:acyl-CoA synthetase (AMP-forming)/AMP-acid ligase II